MADDTTTSTTSDQQLSQIINQLLAGKTAQPAVDPNTGPSSRDGRGILSLLGEGLGGGSQYGSTADREQGGLSALGAAGARMLQASDWSATPHTFGSILGQGLDAARGNLGQTQAVSAARQYATQQLAHQQQEDQINRLKEALPYLQLMQNREAIKGMPGSLLGGGGSNTSIGNAGDGTYVGAIGGHEGTGQNPASSAVGTGQFLRDTWLDFARANPQYFQGMSEKQILDARTVPEFSQKVGPVAIEWLAKQNADVLAKNGVPPSGPVLGIAHYVGAGAAANIAKAPDSTPVASFVGQAALDANPELRTMTVGQMKARYANTPNPSFMSAPAPGQAGIPVPANLAPSAPGAKTQIPPPTAAAPGQAPAVPPPGGIQVTPEPPLATTAPNQTAQGPEAGTAQTAGPGAPTSGVIPASPPGSAADVADIQAGMANAQATPLVRQPGAVVTAQAGGQPPDPNSFEAYRLAHPIAPPAPEQRALFDAGLTPDQQNAHDTQLKALEVQYQAARAKGDPTAAAAAQEKLVTLETATSTLRENARKLAVEKQAEYFKDQDKQRFDAWTAEQADRRAQEKAAQDRQQRLDEIKATAEEGRTSKAAEQEGQYILDERKDMAKTRDAARQSIDQVHVLRALSDRAGTATSLESLTLPNGQTMRDLMVQNGLGSETTLAHLNAQQAYEAAASQMVMDLRKGVQMGSLSDRDLAAVQKLIPKGSTTPEGRANILATIEQAHSRNRDYIDRVHQLWDQGKGLSWEKAKVEADKQMGDIVPQVPQEYNTMTPEQKVGWFKANAPPRTLLRTPDELNKDGKVVRRGHIILVPEAPE